VFYVLRLLCHDEWSHDPLLVYQEKLCHTPRAKMKGKEPKLRHPFDATDQTRMFEICLTWSLLLLSHNYKAVVLAVLVDFVSRSFRYIRVDSAVDSVARSACHES
jgi:hypothetical protein